MIRKKNLWRNEVSDCSFCRFSLLVSLSPSSASPLITQVHLIPPKAYLSYHAALRMQPSVPIFVAKVIDRVLVTGMHEKRINWGQNAAGFVMTKSGIASVLSRLKFYNGQKGTLHAYGAKNFLVVLPNVLPI